MRRFCDSKSCSIYINIANLLTSSRYLSQVRQELAMRLLARVYADGNTPSKVSVIIHSLWIWVGTDNIIVVAKFYET